MLRWETATQYWDPMLPRRRNVINKLSKRRRLHTPGTRPRAEEEERLPTKRHGQIKTEGGRPGGATTATCVGRWRLQTTGVCPALGLLGCRRPRRANMVGVWSLKPTGIRPARGP